MSARAERVERRRSGFGATHRIAGMLMLGVAVIAGAKDSQADTVKGVRVAIESPIAPRGGVMMVPLVSERPGDDWPRTMTARLADDREITGEVAWLSAAPEDLQPVRWTQDPRRLAIRAIERDDNTSLPLDTAAGEGPYLVLRLPQDGMGTMKFGSQTIRPLWCDVPWTDPLRDADALPAEGQLALEDAPDRPDPHSPFEYWRWVLLADRLGLNPPAPAGDEIAQLAASHYASLWRIGLKRLAMTSPRVAQECRTMLTRTAVDRSRTVATWISDPLAATTLLAALLDFSQPEEMALRSAVEWLDRLPPIMLWPEDESGDQVRLAMTLLRDSALGVTFSWLGAPEHVVPSSLPLEPGVIAHVTIQRLPLETVRTLGSTRLVEPSLQTLRVTAGSQTMDMPCGPRTIEARPPGVTFRPLTPPITLADAQFNRAVRMTPERATMVQVRRLGGRWEVFFDARRIVEQEQDVDAATLREFDDLRGIEAVTILIGREDDPDAVWLTIPEHDYPAIARGANLPNLQVHKRSFADRWHARVVLPDEWFSTEHANPAFIGFIRSHGDSMQLETGPAPSPPWRVAPGRIALDLSHWDDMPAPEE